jgi:integrase
MATVKKRGQSWQATYRDPNGKERTRTFRLKADAEGWASEQVAAIGKGRWIDPTAGKVTLKAYSKKWLAGRHDLAVRTSELYEHLLDRWVLPKLGNLTIARVTPPTVREWHAGIAADHPTTAAKAYRLLSSIMRTAVTDDLIAKNPCQVKGAGQEAELERPVASKAQVEALADAMPDHLKIAVLLAAWCQLRRAEVLGLTRQDIDPLHGTLTVRTTRTVTMRGKQLIKEPKSDAGRRTLAVPPDVMPVLVHHLAEYVAAEPDSPVLVGEKHRPVTAAVLHVTWDRARTKVGLPNLRYHDLRHSGLTRLAVKGATTAELMHRGGHASPRAALRYQQATAARDRALADALATPDTDTNITPITAAETASPEDAADISRTLGTAGA